MYKIGEMVFATNGREEYKVNCKATFAHQDTCKYMQWCVGFPCSLCITYTFTESYFTLLLLQNILSYAERIFALLYSHCV